MAFNGSDTMWTLFYNILSSPNTAFHLVVLSAHELLEHVWVYSKDWAKCTWSLTSIPDTWNFRLCIVYNCFTGYWHSNFDKLYLSVYSMCIYLTGWLLWYVLFVCRYNLYTQFIVKRFYLIKLCWDKLLHGSFPQFWHTECVIKNGWTNSV